MISSVSGTSGGSSAVSTAPSTVAPARGSTSGAPSTSSGPPTKQAPTQQAQEDEESDESEYDSEDEDATLDMNVSEIKRKTIAIRGENLQATLMDNIESITASVAQFKKQEKDNPQNDVIALYNNEKENYEQEIEKLTKRLVKQ